ncbi:negative elongation factor D [Striga asiatica]|uniref:Negative elongation factor D n=1 Tax=Striga asiatica TaxID=4170 RepID=A0A5A7QDM6_STRAF|nr:negative elongation factor D [Striga asiatica]
MGSLMAGWDSPISDPNLVKYRRNKSLTKEEIEAFWKSKRQTEEDHLKDISLLSPRSKKILLEEGGESEAGLDKIIRKNGWWVSSNWAFLNEPPVIASEGGSQRYASQFHVGETAGSRFTGRTGIGA